MDAASIAEFNQQKSADLLASYPATIEFTAERGRPYPAAFGEVRDDGTLHESGQATQHHRVGVLYLPRDSISGLSTLNSQLSTTLLLRTFRITACAADRSLVGTVWKIIDQATAAHEPTLKLTCLRQEG